MTKWLIFSCLLTRAIPTETLKYVPADGVLRAQNISEMRK